MFAGPNGSGKSTIKSNLTEELHIKLFVNADELEAQAKATGFIDLAQFGLDATLQQLLEFHINSALLIKENRVDEATRIGLEGTKIDYRQIQVDSYFASVIADFIRRGLLDKRESFTFETVMSHSSKLDILRQAQAAGYRTYLYFVSTENPEINIDRVRIRVEQGGHPVHPDKIRARYQRSLELLPEAIGCCSRAYIFDNSDNQSVLLAEVTEGTQLDFHTEHVPEWFFSAYYDQVSGQQ